METGGVIVDKKADPNVYKEVGQDDEPLFCFSTTHPRPENALLSCSSTTNSKSVGTAPSCWIVKLGGKRKPS